MCAALGGISACDTFETIGSYGTIQGPKIAISASRKTPAAATAVSGLPRRIQPAWRSVAEVIRLSPVDRRCHKGCPPADYDHKYGSHQQHKTLYRRIVGGEQRIERVG